MRAYKKDPSKFSERPKMPKYKHKQGMCSFYVSNQKFVQIPFDQLKRTIGYRTERQGIRVYLQEEPYTSKASFMDGDAIPVYGKGKAEFSGTRNERLYRTKKGPQINADLNGAANILRKCIPDAFKENRPDFLSIEVIRHPDLSCR